MNPNSTPSGGLYGRVTASGAESDPECIRSTNGPQTGAQPIQPLDVIRDAIARAIRDGRYWLPVDGQHALADAIHDVLTGNAEAWRRTAVDRALTLGRHERTLELVAAAIHIADDHDTTDWQRGYRTCAERVQYALGQREQPPTA